MVRAYWIRRLPVIHIDPLQCRPWLLKSQHHSIAQVCAVLESGNMVRESNSQRRPGLLLRCRAVGLLRLADDVSGNVKNDFASCEPLPAEGYHDIG